MEVIDAVYRRRAVRAYTAQSVDRQTVERLLEAAVHAPSAVNAQPWAFVVLQDRARLKAYSDRAKALAGDARDPGTGPLREILSSPDFSIFYDAGTLIIICATDRLRAAEDCALAGENLMLAALSLGLGTCPIGFARPFFNLPEVKAELGIPPDLSPVLSIIVGYPRGASPPVPRDPDLEMSHGP
jgi:nitroreductase